MTTAPINHVALANQIHADNIKAGWWSNLHTGESIIDTRNRPEMLMLIVSELSEASEGWNERCQDDKLPQYPMFEVELADAAIRIYDLLGCEAGSMNFNDAVAAGRAKYNTTIAAPFEVGLMYLVNCISAAMEGHRKGNRENFIGGLTDALGGIWSMSEDYYGLHPLMEIIEAKRNFNAHRADHKPENRRAEGGKAF